MDNTFIEQVRGEISVVEKRLALLKQLESAYDPAAIAEVEAAAPAGKRGKKAAPAEKQWTSAELREEVKIRKAEDPELSPSECAKAIGVSTYRVNQVW